MGRLYTTPPAYNFKYYAENYDLIFKEPDGTIPEHSLFRYMWYLRFLGIDLKRFPKL